MQRYKREFTSLSKTADKIGLSKEIAMKSLKNLVDYDGWLRSILLSFNISSIVVGHVSSWPCADETLAIIFISVPKTITRWMYTK